MAEIPRAALDYLTEEVNGISADAQAKVMKVLERIEWTPNNVAECREIVVAALKETLPVYADAAAQAAADFYDACRTLCVGEKIGAIALSSFDPDAIEGAVRAIVQDVVDGKPVDQVNRKLLDRIDREMKKAAANSTAGNARRDPLKPKWARVPGGAETCSFCLMLASFGFNTSSSDTASHTHANCDCRIVPQWGEDSIEGYDPEGMYERYELCLGAIGGRDGVRREWEALPRAEREAYIASHGKKEGAAFDAFLNKRVSAEIGMRDSGWFRTGEVPDIDYSEVSRSEFGRIVKKSDAFSSIDYEEGNVADRGREWRDLFIHDALSASGIRVKPRLANAPDGYSNIDAEIDGKLYEFKSPEEPKESPKPGRELAFIESNLRGAKKQFGKQFDEANGGHLEYNGLVRVVLSLRYRDVELSDAVAEAVRRMNQHSVDEVVIVTKLGEIMRLKK